MKNGFNKFSLLYSRRCFVSQFNTFPPAISITACPAAVSHSMVGPKRGYTSAFPSATKQNFSELPDETKSTSFPSFFKSSTNCSVSSLKCERLATTFTFCNSRQFFLFCREIFEPSSFTKKLPSLVIPYHILFCAGAYTTPSTG